jgi:hypothetical protein
MRLRVVVEPDQGHGVQHPVEPSVPAAVQPMAGDQPGRRQDRADAGQRGKGRLRPQSAGMRPAHQHLAGADWSHPRQFRQPRDDRLHQPADLALELGRLSGQDPDPQGSQAQRPGRHPVLQRPGRPVTQRGAIGHLAAGATAPELGPQLLRGTDDERLELVDGTGPRDHRTLAGSQQHPQGFPIPAPTPTSLMVNAGDDLHRPGDPPFMRHRSLVVFRIRALRWW